MKLMIAVKGEMNSSCNLYLVLVKNFIFQTDLTDFFRPINFFVNCYMSEEEVF